MTPAMNSNPEQVPEPAGVLATPTGDTDPLWWVERSVWTARMVECLRHGGPEGGKWYSLHDKVFATKTLEAGYARVAANQGAAGVDGMTVEVFGERLAQEISAIQQAWRSGTYRPDAVRRVLIPKPGSSQQRPLGIPTVRDRVVQAALRLVLEPIFEDSFHPTSYGFRPGRSAHQALAATAGQMKAGRLVVVDADLKAFFDSIPHERLLAAVRRKVTDGRVLDLIGLFLKAGVLTGSVRQVSQIRSAVSVGKWSGSGRQGRERTVAAAFDAAPVFDVGRALSGPSRIASKTGSGGVGSCGASVWCALMQ